jgi:iron complex transport system substrate-binding protein
MVARHITLAAAVLAACAAPPAPRGPIVLRDDAGRVTPLSRPAARVVSLIPATTELLFALGAGPQVVGRTRWCDYPAEAAAVASVGDGIAPNTEAIAVLRPDLVVAYRSTANAAGVARLRELSIATVELTIDRFADLERVTALLARATGRVAAGDTLIASLRREIARATVTRSPTPSILVLTWDQPAITLGGGSFLSELIARAGGRNAFADEARPSFPVSIEAIVARDPDFVLVTEDGVPDWAARPEWRAVRAVRERRFLRVTGSEFDRPSPRAPAAIARLARALDSVAR